MIAKLEMLIALAKERHFGRAAESLGITQPSLSAGIKQLEGQLGVQLVQRGSRYGGLTPEGLRTLDWARRIVGDARALREEMRASRSGLSGHLRLAVIPTALSMASDLVAGFQTRHPEIRFTVLSRSSRMIHEMLRNLEIDGGVTYLDGPAPARLTQVPLYRERYVLICKPGHALSGAAHLDWAGLGAVPLCLLSDDMQNRRIINRAFAGVGVDPNVHLESNSTVLLVAHAARGGCATILPQETARLLTRGTDLRLIPIHSADDPPDVGLIAPYRAPHTPLVAALLEEAERLSISID